MRCEREPTVNAKRLDQDVTKPADTIIVESDPAGTVRIVQVADGRDCTITVPKEDAQAVAYSLLRAAAESSQPAQK